MPKRKPANHARARPRDELPEWGERFLAALDAAAGSVQCAARAAKVPRSTARDERARNPALRARWDEIVEGWIDRAGGTAIKRAVEGWDEPLEHQGRLTGEVRRKWDPKLLEWVLKARRPREWDPIKAHEVIHRERLIQILERLAEEVAAEVGAAKAEAIMGRWERVLEAQDAEAIEAGPE